MLLLLMLIAGLNYRQQHRIVSGLPAAGFTLVTMHRCHRNLLGAQLVQQRPNRLLPNVTVR